MAPSDRTQFAPNSAAARDIAYYLHPYTNIKAHEENGPLIINSGKGVYVYDDNGKEYIEGMAGLWCTSLGFGQERLAEAAARQIRKLPFYHGFNQKGHEPQIELAERLLAMAPVPMSKVFFANSGSEAIDTAIKLIWYRNNALGLPDKKKIIGRVKGYHGVTVAAASVTGTKRRPGVVHEGVPARAQDDRESLADVQDLHAQLPRGRRTRLQQEDRRQQ